MTTELILRSFLHNDRSIAVPFTGEAFFNATVAAKAFDKKPNDWLKTQDTQDYIAAISKIFAIEQDQQVVVRQGAPDTGGGTWLHPKLAIQFARWLHPEFAVWCDMQVEEILRGNRGVAAMPAPVASKHYEPGKGFQDAIREDRDILIPARFYSFIQEQSDAYQAQLDDYKTRVIGLQSGHIALLEKLVERGIKL